MPAIRSSRVFRFYDMTENSMGMIELAIETASGIPPIHILLDVFDVDISALVGLDVLDGNCQCIDNVSNRM